MADTTLGAGGEAKFLTVSPEDRERSARALGALQDEARRAEGRLAAHLILDPTSNCGCGEHRKGVVSFCLSGLALYAEAAKWGGVARHARGTMEAMGIPNMPGPQFQVTE